MHLKDYAWVGLIQTELQDANALKMHLKQITQTTSGGDLRSISLKPRRIQWQCPPTAVLIMEMNLSPCIGVKRPGSKIWLAETLKKHTHTRMHAHTQFFRKVPSKTLGVHIIKGEKTKGSFYTSTIKG